MRTVAIDFETYYRKTKNVCKSRPVAIPGIDIGSLGTWHYLRHPEVDIYMLSVHDGTNSWVGHPKDFNWSALKGARIIAHNIMFDWQVVMRLQELGIAPKDIGQAETACTADLVAYLAAPRNLKDASASLLGMSISKDVRDKMSGKKFDDLDEKEKEEVRQYALQDAKTCYTLWEKFNDRWPEHERTVSRINREACIRGMRTDMARVNEGVAKLEEVMETALVGIPWGKSSKPLSPGALLNYCNTQGIPCPESTAEDDEEFEAWANEYAERFPVVSHMRTWRKANTAYKKLKVLQTRTRPDGRYQVELKYGAAEATLRFGGAAQFNVHNLPKDIIHGVDVRACLLPEEGQQLLDIDWVAVEPRITSWITGNKPMLEALASGLDPYEAAAIADGSFTGTPGTLRDTNKALRQLKKAQILGLSYGLSNPDKFVRVAKLMADLTLTPQQAAKAVDDFQQRNPLLTSLWKHLMREYKKSVRSDFLMALPSGRTITYGRVDGNDWSYEKVLGKESSRRRAWHGLLVENCLTATTPVVTLSGIKKIIDVTSDDLVWDGVAWARTDGCVYKGKQEVGVWVGVRVTSNHLILVGRSFKSAMRLTVFATCLALLRGQFSVGLRLLLQGVGKMEKLCASAFAALRNFLTQELLSVRRHLSVCSARLSCVPTNTKECFLQEDCLNYGSTAGPGSYPAALTPNALPTLIMAGGGYRCITPGWMTLSLSFLMQRLSLGGTNSALIWTASTMRGITSRVIYALYPVWRTHGTEGQWIVGGGELGISTTGGNQSSLVSFGTRMRNIFREVRRCFGWVKALPEKLCWQPTNSVEPTYDLVNCGPRNRFAIKTPYGEVIVHNCSQAIARDCLADAIVRLDKLGVVQHFSVHDSIVCSVKDKAQAEEVAKVMRVAPSWAPGLPLDVDYKLTERYTK